MNVIVAVDSLSLEDVGVRTCARAVVSPARIDEPAKPSHHSSWGARFSAGSTVFVVPVYRCQPGRLPWWASNQFTLRYAPIRM
jgi:hypothetical protein